MSAPSSHVRADSPRAKERHREKQVSPTTRLADAEALEGEKLGEHSAALPWPQFHLTGDSWPQQETRCSVIVFTVSLCCVL